MPGTAEMGVAEAYNAFIFVLIAGTVTINVFVVFAVDLIHQGVGLRTELHSAKRNRGAWKSMAHFGRTDQRIDVFPGLLLRVEKRDRKHQNEGKRFCKFHVRGYLSSDIHCLPAAQLLLG